MNENRKKKPIREALLELGQSFAFMAGANMRSAEKAALDALDGNAEARIKAYDGKARAEAFKVSMDKLDQLRNELENGTIG